MRAFHFFWTLQVSLLLIVAFLPSCTEDDQSSDVSTFYQEMLQHNDEVVRSYLGRQELHPESPNYGGFADRYEIYNPGSTASIFQRLTVAYVSAESEYYQQQDLLESMILAVDFLLRKQHEDGTIDLLSTNFHSTPDLAFAVEPMALSYKVMLADTSFKNEDLMSGIRRFLERGADALVVGGVHTPNHRWVVSMALARLHELFPEQAFIDRIETWLNEGIDIDADGQFTERSTSVYSPLTDRCLITIARIMDKPELYDPVRRNLEMSLYYMHPNGEVVTEASRRQDQYQAKMPSAYYYPYLYMMHEDKNPKFGGMVTKLEDQLGPELLSGSLIYFLEDPSLNQDRIIDDLPDTYVKHFPESELVRMRSGTIDATVIAKNPAIFTMHKGGAVLQAVRLSTAFFGKGQMKADTLLVEGSDRYLLKQKLVGPYYQPYPVDSLPGDGDWEKMDRNNRPKSETQELEYQVWVSRSDTSYHLRFSVTGTDHVPLALELAFRNGGTLEHVDVSKNDPQSYFLPSGYGQYRQGESVIKFGPGQKEHEWTQLRGADPKLDAMSVYVTGYTPFEYTLEIR